MTSHPTAGPTVLITGASRGFGRALALQFAARGCQVIAWVRSESAIAELQRAAGANGGAISGAVVDMKSMQAIDEACQGIARRGSKLDIVIGNAGILFPHVPLAQHTEETWNELLDVNLTANWRLIRALDPLLRAQGGARFFFVSSRLAHPRYIPHRLDRFVERLRILVGRRTGMESRAQTWRANSGGYAVSKAGLEKLAMIYAAECEGSPVSVAVIDPGAMRTEMRARAVPDESPGQVPAPELIAQRLADIALGPGMPNGDFRFIGSA